jgi:membrane protease YdiL (CAAX protease family)
MQNSLPDNTPVPLIYMTSLFIDQQAFTGRLQPAAVLIQAGLYHEAHRLLLTLVNDYLDNPDVWLMLAWTAPSLSAANQYYQECCNLDPANELAKAGLAYTNNALHNRNASSLSQNTPFLGHGVAPSPHTLSPQTNISAQNLSVSSPFSGFTNAFSRVNRSHFMVVLMIYLLLLGAAELVTTFDNPILGLVFHGVVMVALFLHASISRVNAQRRLLFSLSLGPLIRLLSLSMPLVDFQYPYWYAIIGLPLIFSAFMVYQLTGYKLHDVGLSARRLPLQLHLVMLGFALGWAEFQILRPAPLVESMRWQDILIPALILLVFTGFLEEFIFRGLMQRTAEDAIGKYAILYISLLFAILHIGYRSVLDFCFVLFVGLIFAYIVKRTQSIWGVTLAHGVTNITLYIVMPFLLHL